MMSALLISLLILQISVSRAADQWSWKELSPSMSSNSLSRREGHTSVAAEHMLVVFGGCYLDNVCFNDVAVLDTNTNEWLSPIVDGVKPAPREGHSASLIGTSMYVFGGSSDQGYMNDVHVLDLQVLGDVSSGNEPHMAWGRPDVKGDAPEAREGHSGTAIDRGVLIFGGVTEKRYHNDLYLLEIDTMSWKLVEPKAGVAPTPREGHTATIYMDKLFIFGGFTDRGDTALNDMHVLDVKSMIWSRPNFSGDRPKPRQYATSIRHGSKILVTGGCDFGKKSCFNDMYELDLKSKSWSETEFMSDKSYPPREDFTLTVVRNRVFLVGGCFLTHRCFGGEEISELVTPHASGWRCGGNNCTGNGVCRHGLCMCFPGFMGVDCAERMTCPKACSGHGRCTSTGKCVCTLGFSGYDCSNSETCPEACSGRGQCLPGGVCRCIPGWEGKACDVCRLGSRVACNAHGICVKDTSSSSSKFRFQQTRPIMLGSSRDGTSGARFVSGGTALMASSSSSSDGKTYKCKCDRNWLGDVCTTDAKAKPKDIDAPPKKKKEEKPGKKLEMTRVVDKYATPDYGSGEDAKPSKLSEDKDWWDNPPGSTNDDDESLTDSLRLVSHRTSVDDSSSSSSSSSSVDPPVKQLSENDEKVLLGALMRGVIDDDDDDDVVVKEQSKKRMREKQVVHHEQSPSTKNIEKAIDSKQANPKMIEKVDPKKVDPKKIEKKTCPKKCETLGHGICHEGHCYCKQGFYEEDCSVEIPKEEKSPQESLRYFVVSLGVLVGMGTAFFMISRGIISRSTTTKSSLKTTSRREKELPEWVGF